MQDSFLNRMLNLLRQDHHSHLIHLNPDFYRDLNWVCVLRNYSGVTIYYLKPTWGGLVVWQLEFSPPTSEAAGSNIGPCTSCWKVGSYLPMPGGLQSTMHWFPPPVNYPSQYDLGC